MVVYKGTILDTITPVSSTSPSTASNTCPDDLVTNGTSGNLYDLTNLGKDFSGCVFVADGAADIVSTPKVSSSDWNNTVSPPRLTNPIIIEISDDYATKKVNDFDRVGCEGLIHDIIVPNDRDVKIVMKKGSGPLKYPLWVTGGSNAHIIGIESRPIIQSGCDVGEAHQTRASKYKNIHPRLPGGKLFRLQQVNKTFVEGVDIDLQGMEADCFAVRNAGNTKGRENSANAMKNRHFSFLNTRCVGIEGLDDSSWIIDELQGSARSEPSNLKSGYIGDGIHGDFFQNQGDSVGSFTAENVTVRSSSNGIVLHSWFGSASRPTVNLKNFDYAADLRYYGDDKYEKSQGLPLSGGKSSNFSVKNVYLDEPRGLNYLRLSDGTRIGAKSSSYITAVPGIHEGLPLVGQFAPDNKTGLEYVSPF